VNFASIGSVSRRWRSRLWTATRQVTGSFARHEPYRCPICAYHGPFEDTYAEPWVIRDARCPACDGHERHRLQFLVMESVQRTVDLGSLEAIHFAPEPCLSNYLEQHCKSYASADLAMRNVDHRVDLTLLPFDDASYDLAYASHVLEHIVEDLAAIAEIRRILRPGGIAVLPVPILGERTVEYPTPREWGHVRAPGLDYFDRYRQFFSEVTVYRSEDFPAEYQAFVRFKGPLLPHWPPQAEFLQDERRGYRLTDFVPVCRV